MCLLDKMLHKHSWGTTEEDTARRQLLPDLENKRRNKQKKTKHKQTRTSNKRFRMPYLVYGSVPLKSCLWASHLLLSSSTVFKWECTLLGCIDGLNKIEKQWTKNVTMSSDNCKDDIEIRNFRKRRYGHQYNQSSNKKNRRNPFVMLPAQSECYNLLFWVSKNHYN